MSTVLAYNKNPNLGNKILYKSRLLYIESEDAATLIVGEKVTLMNWGNAVVTSITTESNGS